MLSVGPKLLWSSSRAAAVTGTLTSVAVHVPLLLGSATLVATIVTGVFAAIDSGGVYSPVGEIVPASTPEAAVSDHVTAVFSEPVTAATYWDGVPTATILLPVIVTPTLPGMSTVKFADCTLPGLGVTVHMVIGAPAVCAATVVYGIDAVSSVGLTYVVTSPYPLNQTEVVGRKLTPFTSIDTPPPATVAVVADVIAGTLFMIVTGRLADFVVSTALVAISVK